MPRKANFLPSIEYIHRRFDVDLSAGSLKWKPRDGTQYYTVGWNRKHAGKEAGFVDPKGYRHVGIDGVFYLAHRLLWMMANGVDPGDLQVDHINRVKTDNSKGNLRIATNSQNQINSPKQATANKKAVTSPFKGVRRREGARGVRFHASISVNKKEIYLGTFNTAEQANEARIKGAETYHGEFGK